MKIKSIKKSTELQHTYDIEVPNDHHYIFGNGCVSHNSSLVTNSTNGIEPPRSLITSKKSKQGVIKMLIPEANKLKNKYSFAFGFSNKDMNNIVCIMQKWMDQGISVNHYYDHSKYKDNVIPTSEIATDLLYFYKMGGKQLYYANTSDNKTDDFSKVLSEIETKLDNSTDEAGCESGACSV